MICVSTAVSISLRANAVSHRQSEREGRQVKNEQEQQEQLEETDEAESKSKEITALQRPSDPARNLLFENNGEGMRIKRRLL